MSFLTALGLSFNNLLTKKGRTLMTAFAGSIGIIGIASILALANGVGAHIKGIEEETLSMYPLSIQRQGVDLTSLLMSPEGRPATDQGEADGDDRVREFKVLDRMLSRVSTNDLISLKEFLDEGGGGVGEFVNAVEYNYDVTPQIYLPDSGTGVHQVHPDSTFSALGFGGGMAADTPLVAAMTTSVFSELVGDLGLVEDQYDVVAGDWPRSADEVLVVLSERGGLSDYMFYGLGLRDRTQLEAMVEQLVNEEEVVIPQDSTSFTIDDVMGARFRLVHATDHYTYDETYEIWTDRSTEETHVSALVAGGEELRVAGIVRPKADASATPLDAGLYYTPMLTRHVLEQAAGALDELSTEEMLEVADALIEWAREA